MASAPSDRFLALPFRSGDVWTLTNVFYDPRTSHLYGPEDTQRHAGIDWDCCAGTPVYAMAAGTVTKAHVGAATGPRQPSLGNEIAIQTRATLGGALRHFRLTYAHLAIVQVAVGQTVQSGDLIGYAGTSGFSTAPHLHVEYAPATTDGTGFQAPTDFSPYLPLGVHPDPPPGTDPNAQIYPYAWQQLPFAEYGAVQEGRALSQEEVDAINARKNKALNASVNRWAGSLCPRLQAKPGPAAVPVYTAPRLTARTYRAALDPMTEYAIVGKENEFWTHNRLWFQLTVPTQPHPFFWQIDFPAHPVGWVYHDPDQIALKGQMAQVAVTWPAVRDARVSYLRRRADLSYAQMRRAPDTTSDGLTRLTDGQWHWIRDRRVVKDSRDIPHLWYQIRRDAHTGWVRADVADVKAVLAAGDQEHAAAPAAYLQAKASAAADPAVLAAPHIPAVGGNIVGTLPRRSTKRYAVLGKDAETAAWWHTRFSDDVVGWVDNAQVDAHHAGGVPVAWPPQACRASGFAQALPVRTGPGTAYDAPNAIGTADNRHFTIVGKDAAAPGWWRIRLNDTVQGWIQAVHAETQGALDHIPVVASAAALAASTPYAQTRLQAQTDLVLYQGPRRADPVVARVPAGAAHPFRIVGKQGSAPVWWQIQYNETLRGWIRDGDVRTGGPTATFNAAPRLGLWAPTAARLSVRSGPSLAHDSARSLAWSPSLRYAIVGKNAAEAAWWQIRISETVTGWVDAAYAHTSGDLSAVPIARFAAATGPQASWRTGATDGLDVRAGPGVSHTRVGRIANGSTTRYAIVGKDAATAGWWQIRFSETLAGWVRAARVQTHGNASGVTVTWVLQAVRRLAVAANGARALNVTWQAPASGPTPTGYDVQYRQQGASAWTTLAHTGTGATAALSGLTPKTTYEVQVRATQGTGQGPWQSASATTAAVPQLSLKTTTTLGLNVRSGPGTNHSRVGSIAGGSTAKYDILGKDAASPVWWQIRFSDTVTGWVHGTYVQTHGNTRGVAVTWVLQAVRNLTVTANGPRALNVTWQAPASGPTPTGYDVQYRQQGANAWINQAHSGTGATAALSGLTPKTTYAVQVRATRSAAQGSWTAAQGVTAAVPQLSLKATTTLGLNVRSGPGTSHGRVGSIAGGSTAKYDILGQSGTSPVWWQIRFSDTVTGWVHGTYVQTHGNTRGVAVTWILQAVRRLAVAANGPRALNVTWQAPASGPTPTGYDVQYRQQGASAWTTLAHTGTGATAALSGLTPKTTYEAQVRATRTAAQGPWTAAQGATAAVPQLSLKATTTLGLNVRSGPGTSHGRVGSIAGGSTAKYDILGKDAASPVWWQIRFSDTVTGWVHGTYVQTHGSTRGVSVTWVLQAVRRLAVAAHGSRALNVTWQAPAGGPTPTGYDVQYRQQGANAWTTLAHTGTGATAALSGLTPKTTYAVQVRATRTAAQGPWTAAQGATAAVPQLSLKATTTLGLNVRSGPGTTYAVVGRMAGGATTKYDILGKDAASPVWWQIRFGATVTGWVHGTYVQTHGSLSNVAVVAAPPQLSLKRTTTWGLNVRAGAGTGHRIVGTIAGGSTARYDILGKNAATPTWWQIRFSATVTGWVHAAYVQTHGRTSNVPRR